MQRRVAGVSARCQPFDGRVVAFAVCRGPSDSDRRWQVFLFARRGNWQVGSDGLRLCYGVGASSMLCRNHVPLWLPASTNLVPALCLDAAMAHLPLCTHCLGLFLFFSLVCFLVLFFVLSVVLISATQSRQSQRANDRQERRMGVLLPPKRHARERVGA